MQPLKTLQCDYWNWGTWKKTIPPHCFLQTKDSQVVLQTDNKIQGSTIQPLTTLKPFELT